MFFIGIWIIGTSFCFADGDDFNSPFLNTNKWGFSTNFSSNFVHTNGYISFESTTEQAPQLGYIYWKEKLSLSNNWTARIQAYINPSFRPSNNIAPRVSPLLENTNALGGEMSFWDGPRYTTNPNTGIVTTNLPVATLDGAIEAQIGVVDNIDEARTHNVYANCFIKGKDTNNLNPDSYKKYFNPNWDRAVAPANDELNRDLQFKEITTDKVLMELGFDFDTGSLYSKMFDFSGDTLGSLIGEDQFAISEWEESVTEVYIVVGSDTYFSLAPQGSATLDNFEIVPEPSALSLLVVGLGGLAILRRRRS